MEEKDYNNNGFSEASSTGFPDDEFIQTVSETILSEPRFVLSSTDTEYLYSKNQMVSMFKLGYDACQKKSYLKRKSTKKSVLPPYNQLRNMEVGEKLQFPYDVWGAVRTAACKIKQEFGSTFRTRKITHVGEKGPIEVLRLS